MDIENDKATAEWLDSQKKETMYAYRYSWQFFLKFTELAGDQILKSRKADKEYMWERKTLQFKTWLVQRGLSDHTAVSATTAVRSFFSFYRLDLNFKRTEKARLTEATRKTEDYLFNREDLRKMFDVGDLEERYVLTAGKSFGLRAGDFLRLTRGDLQPYLNRETPISIGVFATRKERIRAHPFIDSDALPIIKVIIEKMDRSERTNPKDRILTFSDEMQLSRVLKRLVQKAGIETGSKTVRFHNLRKFLIDRISSVMSESKWKQVIGKKICEAAYVSSENLREGYAKAMAETCFTKVVDEGNVQSIVKKQVLIELAKNMGISEDQITTMFMKKKTASRQIKGLQSLIAQKRRQTQTRHNGGQVDCDFEQIEETQLLGYLKAGWSIVEKLGNGQVIVKRQPRLSSTF